MGFIDWFKGTFGKQTCAFCGNEVGMMRRKIFDNHTTLCAFILYPTARRYNTENRPLCYC